MSKKEKPYNYEIKLKRGFFIRAIKVFLRLFKKKPRLIDNSGGLERKAIYLSNHSGADGPLTYELYFPYLLTCWGAHEMFGNVKERWNYLYRIFYRRKLHWGRGRAFFVATLFAPISKLIYRGIGLIPTYADGRFITSVKTSCRILDKDSPILIFPEDSSDGYNNPPESLNMGFITMAKLYYKMRGEDLPVYTAYLINEKHRKLAVAKPVYVNSLLKKGMTEEEICDLVLKTMQSLYYENSEVFAAEETKLTAVKNKQSDGE